MNQCTFAPGAGGIRPIKYSNGVLSLLDQRRLPTEELWLEYDNYLDVAEAIQRRVSLPRPHHDRATAFRARGAEGLGGDSCGTGHFQTRRDGRFRHSADVRFHNCLARHPRCQRGQGPPRRQKSRVGRLPSSLLAAARLLLCNALVLGLLWRPAGSCVDCALCGD